jgi:hypothetical protein
MERNCRSNRKKLHRYLCTSIVMMLITLQYSLVQPFIGSFLRPWYIFITKYILWLNFTCLQDTVLFDLKSSSVTFLLLLLIEFFLNLYAIFILLIFHLSLPGPYFLHQPFCLVGYMQCHIVDGAGVSVMRGYERKQRKRTGGEQSRLGKNLPLLPLLAILHG